MLDNDEPTPLSFPNEGRCEGVVKILLGREELNPDKPNNRSRAPLLFAAQNGYAGVV